MDEKQRILIVDDDAEIRNLLADFLTQHQYQVDTASNGVEMYQRLEQQNFDLIVLDVMMPGDDGIELCRQLRKSSRLPVIMVSAVSSDVDRIIGLEMGADDYISKPFNPRELLARVKAVLRRSDDAMPERDVKDEVLGFSGWQMNVSTRCLTSPDGLEVTLSAGEYDLLIAFLENAKRVLSRDQLLDITRNRPAGPFDRSIDVQVSRLRHKLEVDSKKPLLIKTVRGGGYLFTATVERS